MSSAGEGMAINMGWESTLAARGLEERGVNNSVSFVCWIVLFVIIAFVFICKMYYSVPLLFVFFRRNSGLRAVLIFRRWSKYMKNAKFYAELNGYIADVWKRQNRAAIRFLLKRCFRCRIEYHRYCSPDEKKIYVPTNQWHVLPFSYLKIHENLTKHSRNWGKTMVGQKIFSYEKSRNKFRRSWFAT